MGQDRDARIMFLLDSFLDEHKDEVGDTARLGAVPVDYVSAYLDSKPDAPETSADTAIRSKAESLLDAFLSGGSESLDIDLKDVPESDDSQDDEQTECAESLDDSYFTETLARIYLKQHRYDKALEIIRSLYLNFPNKSIYFADQIRFLEKLVRINQK